MSINRISDSGVVPPTCDSYPNNRGVKEPPSHRGRLLMGLMERVDDYVFDPAARLFGPTVVELVDGGWGSILLLPFVLQQLAPDFWDHHNRLLLFACVLCITMIVNWQAYVRRPLIDRRIEQLTRASQHLPKHALILQSSDWPRTFPIWPMHAFPSGPERNLMFASRYFVENVRRLVKGGYAVQRELISEEEMTLPFEPRKWDIVWLRCHGCREEMHLGGVNFWALAEGPGGTASLKALSKLLKNGGPDTTLILESCLVGSECRYFKEGEKNIAERLAEYCPWSSVYASSMVVYPNSLYLEKDGAAKFSFCGFNTTRVYSFRKKLSETIQARLDHPLE